MSSRCPCPSEGHQFGGVQIDFRRAVVTKEGAALDLSARVAWLRQTIEANSRHSQYMFTVHGMGYKFAE